MRSTEYQSTRRSWFGRHFSGKPLIWKLKKGAALAALLAVAISTVFTDARQLPSQFAEGDPCDILQPGVGLDEARCEYVSSLY